MNQLAVKMSFNQPFHTLEVTMPEGYALAKPLAFWEYLLDMPGVVAITPETDYKFFVTASSQKQPYDYMREIQDAARKQGGGYVKINR